MKNHRFFVLMGAIWLAPHVSTWVGISLGAAYMICAFVFAWQDK